MATVGRWRGEVDLRVSAVIGVHLRSNAVLAPNAGRWPWPVILCGTGSVLQRAPRPRLPPRFAPNRKLRCVGGGVALPPLGWALRRLAWSPQAVVARGVS